MLKKWGKKGLDFLFKVEKKTVVFMRSGVKPFSKHYGDVKSENKWFNNVSHELDWILSRLFTVCKLDGKF